MDEFCLHFSESTFCGFEVSIIELLWSYATVADVLSGEITKELASCLGDFVRSAEKETLTFAP